MHPVHCIVSLGKEDEGGFSLVSTFQFNFQQWCESAEIQYLLQFYLLDEVIDLLISSPLIAKYKAKSIFILKLL